MHNQRVTGSTLVNMVCEVGFVASSPFIQGSFTVAIHANLAIQEGDTASREFVRVHSSQVPTPERHRVRRQSRDYCGQDTEGMVYRFTTDDARFGSERIGWLPFAGPPGSAISGFLIALPNEILRHCSDT
jgi:hypothetical protein